MGGGFAQPGENYGYAKVLKSKGIWFAMTSHDARWFAHPQNDETNNFEMMVTSENYYFATLAHEHQQSHTNQKQKQAGRDREREREREDHDTTSGDKKEVE